MAGIFGATRAPFSFKKLAKQAARDMEDQTLVINGVNTAPALYTILIATDDDPMLAPFYPELSREVREFVKAQAEKRRYVFVGEPLVRFMIDLSCAPASSRSLPRTSTLPRSAVCTRKSAPIKMAWDRTARPQAVPQAPPAPVSSSLHRRSNTRPPCPSSSRHPALPLPTRSLRPTPLHPMSPIPQPHPCAANRLARRTCRYGRSGCHWRRRGPWRCDQHRSNMASPRAPHASARPTRRRRERREPQHHLRAGDHRS